MSFRRYSVFTISVLCFLLLIINCATFKGDLKGKFDKPGEKNYGAEKVSVLFIFSHFRQTKGYDAIPKLDDKREIINGFNDFFQDASNELTNLGRYATFTNFASDVNEPERRAKRDSLTKQHDFVMQIKIMREKSFAKHFLGSLFSSLSLTLLPIPYSYSYSVNVDIFNAKGQLVKTYARSNSLTKWVQTMLIFIYPFHPETRKKEEVYVEFLHDIFRQVEAEKVLRKQG